MCALFEIGCGTCKWLGNIDISGEMKIYTLRQEQRLPIRRDEAWSFFSSPANLNEITPPDIGFETLNDPGAGIYDGQIILYRIGIFPLIKVRWATEIKAVKEGWSFIDEQRFGPYQFWHHHHSFEDIEGGVLVRDVVHYGLGFGPFGAMAHGLFVRRKLDQIFRFRRERLAKLFGEM